MLIFIWSVSYVQFFCLAWSIWDDSNFPSGINKVFLFYSINRVEDVLLQLFYIFCKHANLKSFNWRRLVLQFMLPF